MRITMHELRACTLPRLWANDTVLIMSTRPLHRGPFASSYWPSPICCCQKLLLGW